jgi:hypothetical protein
VSLLWSDEDYHLAAAIQVLHGKIPYRDFWYDKPPLNLLFYLLFGAHVGVALRAADTAFVCLCCILAYRFAASLWSKREGQVAAALLAFFLIFYLIPGVLPLEPDTLMLAPHLAAVYLAWRGKSLWAGIAAGIAFQLNVKGVFLLLLCPTSFGLLGFLIPNAVIFAWLAAAGTLPGYWEQVWKWGWLYASGPAAPAGLTSLLGWFGFHAALLIGAIWLWIRERSRMLWWFLLALAVTMIGLRPAPRYFNLLLPPLVIAASGSGIFLSRKADDKKRTFALVAVVAVCVMLAVPAVRFVRAYINPDSSGDTAMDRESRAAAALINTMAKASDTIFVWGYRPDIFAYTRLSVAGRFSDSQPLTGVPADRHLSSEEPVAYASTEQNRRELVKTSPSFLVDGLSQYNPRLDIHRYPELALWLSQYCEAARAGLTIVYRYCGPGRLRLTADPIRSPPPRAP